MAPRLNRITGRWEDDGSQVLALGGRSRGSGIPNSQFLRTPGMAVTGGRPDSQFIGPIRAGIPNSQFIPTSFTGNPEVPIEVGNEDYTIGKRTENPYQVNGLMTPERQGVVGNFAAKTYPEGVAVATNRQGKVTNVVQRGTLGAVEEPQLLPADSAGNVRVPIRFGGNAALSKGAQSLLDAGNQKARQGFRSPADRAREALDFSRGFAEDQAARQERMNTAQHVTGPLGVSQEEGKAALGVAEFGAIGQIGAAAQMGGQGTGIQEYDLGNGQKAYAYVDPKTRRLTMIDKDKPIPPNIQLQAILDYQKAVNIYTSAPGAKYGGKDAAEITDQQRANAKATMDRLAAFLPANQRGTQPPAVDRTAIGVQPAAVTGPVRVTTQAEYNALPAGTPYIDPNTGKVAHKRA